MYKQYNPGLNDLFESGLNKQAAKEWLDLAEKHLISIRPYALLTTELHLVQVQFCDGHAQHTSTLEALHQGLDYLNSRVNNIVRGENGENEGLAQTIVEFVAIVINSKVKGPNNEQL